MFFFKFSNLCSENWCSKKNLCCENWGPKFFFNVTCKYSRRGLHSLEWRIKMLIHGFVIAEKKAHYGFALWILLATIHLGQTGVIVEKPGVTVEKPEKHLEQIKGKSKKFWTYFVDPGVPETEEGPVSVNLLLKMLEVFVYSARH